MCAKNKQKLGFTIVELLIVIVVIGILAAITIVAYSGIQAKARDASLGSSVTELKKAIALYNAENSVYPLATACPDNNGCIIGDLSAALVPKYISTLPNTFSKVSYARNTNGIGFGLNVIYESKPQCVTGTNPNLSWGWFTSTNLPLC